MVRFCTGMLTIPRALPIVFLFFGSALMAQEIPTYRVYHGERVHFQLDRSSLAVRYGISKSSGEKVSQAAAAGIRVSSVRPMDFDHWNVLALRSASGSDARVNDQINTLSRSPDVQFVSPVFREANGAPVLMTSDILVRFKEGTRTNARKLLQAITPELSVVSERFGNMDGAFLLRSTSRNGFTILASANKLAEHDAVEWAEPDMIISGEFGTIPNDSLFSKLWGIRNTGQFGGTPGADMKGDLAWNITTGDPGVKIMVIDCGVQQDHPDIHQVPGLDFTGQGGGGGPVNSCDNHGTAVAGCASAIINNSIGVVGIAPTCYVLSARTLIANNTCDNTFSSQISWTINALAYAAANNIRITNFSNQFWTTSSALEAEYQQTHDSSGMVHFSAAGNGSTSVYYPASIPVVNAVGAINPKGVIASFSNHGPALDFTAPGDSIWTTDRTGSAGYTSGNYVLYRGTSFASPYAAGVAALILSQFPYFTSSQVEQKMRNSAVDLGAPGYDTIYGWGFVNAYNAVRSSCLLTPPANITVNIGPNQCSTVVNYPPPTSSGNCGPITCVPPSGSLFSVGTTTVVCTDTSGDQCTFTVTVNGGGYNAGVLRDDFNRPNGPLPGSNRWVLIQNQPNNGSMSIVSNAIQPTTSNGNNNFGGVAWDTLEGGGSEASVTVAQKSGSFNFTSFFIYARMNNEDFNTGTGYRLRYQEQSGTDYFEIHRVGPGYGTSTVLASAKQEINPGDVVTFRVLCDNQTMVGLVNGVQFISAKDVQYTPSQWYFALRACVSSTPVRLDNFTVSSQAPTAVLPPPTPVLLAPASGSTNQPATLTLSWNASSGASSYHIQVATDSLFTGMVVDDSTLSSTSRQVGPLSGGTTYYWRVYAENSGGSSAFSAPWNFSTAVPPPAAPILLSPANGSSGQPTALTLKWNKSSGATRYRMQVATDNAFTSKIVDDSTVTDTTRFVSGLANSTSYYWHVSAANSGGWSSYSATWKFTTAAALPAVTVLLAPANGAAVQPTLVQLSWNPTTGATTYHLQLATDSLFTLIVLEDSTLTTTARQVGPLAAQTRYYWRVEGVNTAGNGPYSTPWSFTTTVFPAPVPVLIAPSSGSTGLATTQTLKWGSSTGATGYHVQVATDSLFASLVINDSTVTDTTRVVGPLANSTRFYWRVSALNAGGSSAYAAAWNFTTIIAIPPVPVLTAPANGSTGQPTTLNLTWAASGGAASYHVQVAGDSLFGSIILDDSTVATTSRQVGPLASVSTYFWRVSAKNSAGSSAFSATWNFTTVYVPPPPPPTPALLSPSSGSSGLPLTDLLIWASAPGATRYRVQAATDSLFAGKVLDDSSVTDTTRSLSSLAYFTKYFWRVSAKDTGGSSAFSTAWNFTTVVGIPPAPTLLSPTSGSSCQPTTLTFSWSASQWATSYHLQIARDSLFGTIAVDDSGIAGTSIPVSSLIGGATYYWHVSAKDTTGTSPWSALSSFMTFPAGVLRDDFNRPDGALPGSNDWTLILNQPSSGSMAIVSNAIQATSSAGNNNFGGVAWDTLVSSPAEASLTVVQKSGNFVYTSLFIYAKMNNLDYNTGVGYRLRYFEQSGTDILEIHKVGPGYPNSTTIASGKIEVNPGDVITFRVGCDNKTLTGLVNGVPIVSAVDNSYMPSQWYFAVRGCVFPTPFRSDNFTVTSQLPVGAVARHFDAGEVRLVGTGTVREYRLEQNFPNPFNPTTSIRYALPVESRVTVRVFNTLGQVVSAPLVDVDQPSGTWSVEFDAGSAAPSSGVYFTRLEAVSTGDPARSYTKMMKMLLVK